MTPLESAQFVLNGVTIWDEEITLKLLNPFDLQVRTKPAGSHRVTWEGVVPLGIHSDAQHMWGTLMAPWNGEWGRQAISSVDSTRRCATT